MRLPYRPNPPTPSSAEEAEVVSRIQARRAPRPLQALDLTLLHSPPVADGWNSFLGAIRTRTTVPAAVRELAICRVAVCNEAWYEWAHHAPLAVAAGASDGAMELLKKREDLSAVTEAERNGVGLSTKEWAVLRLADEMTRKVKVDDAVFARLRTDFSDREVVEIVAIVSAYNAVSRFLVALDVGEKNGTGPDASL